MAKFSGARRIFASLWTIKTHRWTFYLGLQMGPNWSRAGLAEGDHQLLVGTVEEAST